MPGQNSAFSETTNNPWAEARDIQDAISRQRTGYVLARVALSYGEGDPGYVRQADNALRELAEAQKTGILEPPLSDELALRLGSFIDAVDAGKRSINGPVSRLLLAWAIDGAH